MQANKNTEEIRKLTLIYNWSRRSKIRKVLTNISKESGDAALITGSGPAKIISFGVPHKLYLKMAMSYMQNSSLFFSHVINKHDDLYELFYNECNHGQIKHGTWLEKGDYKFSTLGSGIEWELWGPGISWARGKSAQYWFICQILVSLTLWISGKKYDCSSLTLIGYYIHTCILLV